MTAHKPLSNIRAEKVIGSSVRNAEGSSIGTIDDLVIGKHDGQVKYAIVSFGGFLGLGSDYFPLPWAQLDFDPEKGAYIVNLTKEQLKDAPRFAKEKEPDWEDQFYADRIEQHYPTYI